jgi:tRNA threonylcarbamoyladenosine biosynthesis protein TsaE
MPTIRSDLVHLTSRGEEETERIGYAIGEGLRGGERLGLRGELGAGKTCLVRGVAAALGLPPELVRSPSFPVILPYEGGRLPLYHIDLFRQAAGAGDVEELREYLYGDGVAAVEWYERLADPLTDYLSISITFVGSHERRVVVEQCGVGYDPALAALRAIR